ncbi:AAA family ATPase [Alteromonas gracilis]|uniref:AAA family ATPase n=1 Tax=Alteromonas gracilis TaxID=1479524 RepID=UPI0030D39516
MSFAEPQEWYPAEYRTHFDIECQGNPLIETLYPQYSEAEFLGFITNMPELPSHFFSMPFEHAQRCIKRLEKAYIPSPLDYEIYRHIHSELVNGYVHRNPITPMQQAKMLGVARGQFLPNPHKNKQTASGSCTLLSGISGIGKTERVQLILKMFQPVIRHELYRGHPLIIDQVPTVSFEISNLKSVKALGVNFFRAIDKLMGTNYTQQWYKGKQGTYAFLVEMQLLAERFGVGFTHIDECQKLLAEAKKDDSPTIHYLESLFNNVGVPIIMTCTEEGVALFDTDSHSDDESLKKFPTTRRLTSGRDIRCERLSFFDDEFQQFIDCFLPLYLFNGTPARSEEFKGQLYDYSQGVHQVLNKLLRLFLDNVHRKRPEPSQYSDVLKGVFDNQFGKLKPALQALKNKNAQMYENEVEKHTPRKYDELAEMQDDKLELSNAPLEPRTLHTSVKGPRVCSEKELKNL